MPDLDIPAATSARERILVTAERLFAEQGTAVSLREIAVEAGQRNNSAVHYHFGSRDALIEAIVELRQESLERERLALLALQEAEGRTGLEALVEALISPMFHAPYADGSTHYARFLEKVRDHSAVSSRQLDDRHWPATTLIIGRINRSLSAVPEPVRSMRLRSMTTVMFALLADVERSGKPGTAPAGTEQHILDMVVGLLTAPITRP